MAWPAAVKSGHHTLLWGLDPQGGYSWPLGKDGSSPPVSIGVQTGPTIGAQKGTTWRRCAGVDAGRGFRAGAGVGRA